MRKDFVLAASFRASQILVYNEGQRQAQLAEKLDRQLLYEHPVDRVIPLFFREDLTEPRLETVSIHPGMIARSRSLVPNLD